MRLLLSLTMGECESALTVFSMRTEDDVDEMTLMKSLLRCIKFSCFFSEVKFDDVLAVLT